MKINCNCKFCQRDIEMDADQSGFENPVINAKLWLKNIACTRCAAYYESKRKITDAIGKLCNIVQNARGDEKVLRVVCAKMILKTQQLSKLVCDFKMIQYTWDEAFPNMLVEAPDKFSLLINRYCSGLNQIQAAYAVQRNDD